MFRIKRRKESFNIKFKTMELNFFREPKYEITENHVIQVHKFNELLKTKPFVSSRDRNYVDQYLKSIAIPLQSNSFLSDENVSEDDKIEKVKAMVSVYGKIQNKLDQSIKELEICNNYKELFCFSKPNIISNHHASNVMHFKRIVEEKSNCTLEPQIISNYLDIVTKYSAQFLIPKPTILCANIPSRLLINTLARCSLSYFAFLGINCYVLPIQENLKPFIWLCATIFHCVWIVDSLEYHFNLLDMKIDYYNFDKVKNKYLELFNQSDAKK